MTLVNIINLHCGSARGGQAFYKLRCGAPERPEALAIILKILELGASKKSAPLPCFMRSIYNILQL